MVLRTEVVVLKVFLLILFACVGLTFIYSVGVREKVAEFTTILEEQNRLLIDIAKANGLEVKVGRM